MGNLRAAAGPAPPQPQPILRKTASESNLLKMKSKRLNSLDGGGGSRLGATPYHRQHPAIPEATAVLHTPSSSTHSSSSCNSSPNELNSPSNSVPQDLSRTSAVINSFRTNDGSSAPTSPKTGIVKCGMGGNGVGIGLAAILSSSSSTLNSKSLPNIPSAVAMNRLTKDGLPYKRQSPPPNLATYCTSNSSMSSQSDRGQPQQPQQPQQQQQQQQQLPHHGAMIVRRSKSSAILPLRKHLIEKSLMKPHALDEEQFYYQQKQKERLLIRPIEEVMEEPPSNSYSTSESMEVDPHPSASFASAVGARQHPPNFTARLGTSGLSPLVLSEVGPSITNDYFARLLPRQPLDLAVQHSDGSAYDEHPQDSADKTGLGYDPVMLRHHCTCGDNARHPEHPSRLLAIWNRLQTSGLADNCVRVARRATLEEIQSCHSETHALVYGTDMVNRCSLTGSQELNRDNRMGKFCRLECGGIGVDADTYWNELETPPAVRTAVGTICELSQKVARGEVRNGFALIRPPGHHAEYEEAMGFCYFNSVAIAARQLQLKAPNVGRILIVDWAIHHGNGTQKVFYDDPSVLYISLHRHDNGNFYPGTGGPVECGIGHGVGYNINIAWAGGLDPPMGDAEYLAAFRSVVMPVARAFDPDIVLVSCGFDASAGHPHPIGGYLVSTACFAYMTKQLKELARGKVVLALEGGFNLDVLTEATEQCVRALAGLPIEKIAEAELHRRPCAAATETLQKTMAIQTPYWNVLRANPDMALLSHLEAWERERDKSDANALTAMAGLSVDARVHQQDRQQQQQQQQQQPMMSVVREAVERPGMSASN